MNALDTLFNISRIDCLVDYPFKYCLVDEEKHPFTVAGTMARPNHEEDFCNMSDLLNLSVDALEKYKGLGVSIQASKICAIDIDHCVSNPFDANGISPLAQDIINLFKKFAYVEFSFSGTGIRIFFQASKVDDYEQKYYTKNSKLNVEYYYPEGSNRYVTITGRAIACNYPRTSKVDADSALQTFLTMYMKRQHISSNHSDCSFKDDRPVDELMKRIKFCYMTDFNFQNLWFEAAPGSGHDESERDYHLVAYIYDYVTKDKDKIKQIFEQSPFYKTKDWKHMSKWQKQDFRYFNYLYDRIKNK